MIGYIIAVLVGFFVGLGVMVTAKNKQYEEEIQRQNRVIKTLKDQVEMYRRGYKDE